MRIDKVTPKPRHFTSFIFIQKAIKAKLTELGSYIDDELPDYIMVMIANKKDMSQMANDLELFLSENAEPFTTW